MIEDKNAHVRLRVHVQPRAARTEIVGEHGDSLKVRIAAPPVDGEANAELARFIAKLMGVARSQVRVASGENSRQKVLDIEGVSGATVKAAIQHALDRRK